MDCSMREYINIAKSLNIITESTNGETPPRKFKSQKSYRETTDPNLIYPFRIFDKAFKKFNKMNNLSGTNLTAIEPRGSSSVGEDEQGRPYRSKDVEIYINIYDPEKKASVPGTSTDLNDSEKQNAYFAKFAKFMQQLVDKKFGANVYKVSLTSRGERNIYKLQVNAL